MYRRYFALTLIFLFTACGPAGVATTVPPLAATFTLTPILTPEPSGDGIHWTVHQSPVIDVGVTGSWNSALVGEPRVFKTDFGFDMIFVGQDGTLGGDSKISPFFGYALGMAHSPDGISWTEALGNPIISLTGSDFGMLWHGGVIRAAEYFVYYTVGTTLDGRIGQRIFLATSINGVDWVTGGEPVIDLGPVGSHDGYTLLAPTVIVEDDLFKMWYNGMDELGRMTINYATSPDGVAWTKFEGNPVVDLGPDTAAYYPAVIRVGEEYMMWFSSEGIRLATSPDGIAWTVSPDAVIEKGDAGEWSSEAIYEPSVYFDGRVFHMWFTGSSGPFMEKIGYATSP